MAQAVTFLRGGNIGTLAIALSRPPGTPRVSYDPLL